jgi:hypothetical protein
LIFGLGVLAVVDVTSSPDDFALRAIIANVAAC